MSHLEGFDLARELPASYIAEGSSLGPNTWPEEIPGFQHDVYTLYEETTTLSHLLFKSFAEMLDLPPNTFLVSEGFRTSRHIWSNANDPGLLL